MSNSVTIAGLEEGSEKVLRPVKRRVRLRDLWTSRSVARMIGLRDIKVKYKQAALGPLWIVLAPLGMLVAVTVAFSGVTSVHTGDVPYVLFALVGLFVWTYLQLSILIGASAIAGNTPLVRRSAIPRLALVTGGLLGNSPPAAVMLGVSLVLAALYGVLPLQALLLPGLLLWLLVFVGSATLLVASIAVRYRDIVAVMPLVVQAGLFVTPVGYPIEGAPANIKVLLTLNPVSGLIEVWRWGITGTAADLTVVAIGVGWTVALAVLGWQVFTRLEVHFSDVI
jgi:lipopolysaccharide transport system permease protein